MADNPPPEEQKLDSVKQAFASKKRKRTVYTKEQIMILIQAFEVNAYPGIEEREELAARLNVDEGRIHVWFQNRRARLKEKQASSASTCSSEQMGEENPSESDFLEEHGLSPPDTSRSPFWPGEPGHQAGPSTSCLIGRRRAAANTEPTQYYGHGISQSNHVGSSQTTRLSTPLQPSVFPRPISQGNFGQCGSFWVQHGMKQLQNYGPHTSFQGGVEAALQDQEQGMKTRQFSNHQPLHFQGTYQLPPQLQQPHPQQPQDQMPPVPQPPPQLQQPYRQQSQAQLPSLPQPPPQLQQPYPQQPQDQMPPLPQPPPQLQQPYPQQPQDQMPPVPQPLPQLQPPWEI